MEKWKCPICGKEVAEGQRFAQIGENYAHIECIRRIIAEKKESIPLDLEASLDALEATLYALIRTKEALKYSVKRDVKEVLEKHLSILEDQALILSLVVEGELRDHGII